MDNWILSENDINWFKMYGLAKKYYEKYGNLEIPSTFKTSDGVTYDKNGVNLGMWLAKQRQRCNRESERGKLLLSIGMRVERKSVNRIRTPWNEMFELAEKYFNLYHNLDIPYKFRTKDGITYDPNGVRLGEWVYRQEKKCDPDSERGKLLLSIGIEFRSVNVVDKDAEWMKMYLVAVKYYQDNGNLNVPLSYKTEDGLELGKWIVNQRDYYRINRLSEEKIFLLNSIGMIWEKRKNNFDISVMCDENHINLSKNTVFLKNKAFTEFRVKLAYLKDNGINVVDEEGILHEIFSMSSMNMKLKYNVSLEDLVNMYNKEKSK